MPIFLLAIILLLLQHTFDTHSSLKQIEQYENQGILEILRGHPELLTEILTQENTQKSPRKITDNPVTPLKGSTEKTNDNK